MPGVSGVHRKPRRPKIPERFLKSLDHDVCERAPVIPVNVKKEGPDEANQPVESKVLELKGKLNSISRPNALISTGLGSRGVSCGKSS